MIRADLPVLHAGPQHIAQHPATIRRDIGMRGLDIKTQRTDRIETI